MIFMHLVKPKKNGLLSWYFKDCIYAPINKEMIPYKEIREDFENIYCEFSRTNYQKKVSHFPNCRMTKNNKLYVEKYGGKFFSYYIWRIYPK